MGKIVPDFAVLGNKSDASPRAAPCVDEPEAYELFATHKTFFSIKTINS
jgi:hypothetical protein